MCRNVKYTRKIALKFTQGCVSTPTIWFWGRTRPNGVIFTDPAPEPRTPGAARGKPICATISDRATPHPLDWVNPVSRRLTGRDGTSRTTDRLASNVNVPSSRSRTETKHEKSTKELRHTAAAAGSLPVKIPARYWVKIDCQETL